MLAYNEIKFPTGYVPGASGSNCKGRNRYPHARTNVFEHHMAAESRCSLEPFDPDQYPRGSTRAIMPAVIEEKR